MQFFCTTKNTWERCICSQNRDAQNIHRLVLHRTIMVHMHIYFLVWLCSGVIERHTGPVLEKSHFVWMCFSFSTNDNHPFQFDYPSKPIVKKIKLSPPAYSITVSLEVKKKIWQGKKLHFMKWKSFSAINPCHWKLGEEFSHVALNQFSN